MLLTTKVTLVQESHFGAATSGEEDESRFMEYSFEFDGDVDGAKTVRDLVCEARRHFGVKNIAFLDPQEVSQTAQKLDLDCDSLWEAFDIKQSEFSDKGKPYVDMSSFWQRDSLCLPPRATSANSTRRGVMRQTKSLFMMSSPSG